MKLRIGRDSDFVDFLPCGHALPKGFELQEFELPTASPVTSVWRLQFPADSGGRRAFQAKHDALAFAWRHWAESLLDIDVVRLEIEQAKADEAREEAAQNAADVETGDQAGTMPVPGREARLELTLGRLGFIRADGSKWPQRLRVSVTLEHAHTGSALFSGGTILLDERIGCFTESPYTWVMPFNVPGEDITLAGLSAWTSHNREIKNAAADQRQHEAMKEALRHPEPVNEPSTTRIPDGWNLQRKSEMPPGFSLLVSDDLSSFRLLADEETTRRWDLDCKTWTDARDAVIHAYHIESKTRAPAQSALSALAVNPTPLVFAPPIVGEGTVVARHITRDEVRAIINEQVAALIGAARNSSAGAAKP